MSSGTQPGSNYGNAFPGPSQSTDPGPQAHSPHPKNRQAPKPIIRHSQKTDLTTPEYRGAKRVLATHKLVLQPLLTIVGHRIKA